jgi:hypothetical protein
MNVTTDCTIFETTIAFGDLEYDIFAEVSLRYETGAAAFEHFGFRGQQPAGEASAEVSNFSASVNGQEVTASAIRRALRPILADEVASNATALAARVGLIA